MNNVDVLAEYDAIQTEMMEELCIQVDAEDNIIGPISKFIAHREEGVRHRAFSVLIFNEDNELLIQRRSLDKITFPGVWANSCCSHPLYVENELFSESIEGVANAAIRKMPQELGLDSSKFKTEDFNLIGRFEYASKNGEGWIEHEIDYVIGIHADVEIKPNENEVVEYKWVSKNDLELFCSDKGNDIAPWFLAIKELYLDDWWPKSKNDYPQFDAIIYNKGLLA